MYGSFLAKDRKVRRNCDISHSTPLQRKADDVVVHATLFLCVCWFFLSWLFLEMEFGQSQNHNLYTRGARV
jgi:hypothetical protein